MVWRWKFYWRRDLRVLELRQLDQLKHMLSGVQFILNKKDTRVWEADSQARFPVNTLSKLIDRVVLPKSCTVLLSIMEKNWVLQRQMFSFGCFFQNRVYTREFLLHRNLIDIVQSKCSFCHSSAEDVRSSFFLAL